MSDTIEGPLLFLGLAKKADKLKCGEDAVVTAAVSGKARLVLIASDTSDRVLRRLVPHTGSGSLKAELPYTKEQVGRALGTAQTAIAALTDYGLAFSFVKKLAAEFPGKYDEIMEELGRKAEKAARRKKETLKRGGKKKNLLAATPDEEERV